MHEAHSPLRWRLGIFAAAALTLVALCPQFNLIRERGRNWNGAYVFFSQDEIAYSAYINALLLNRPRRNDPYTGRDDSADSKQPESLFSIQFVPAYMVALPARALGLSASTAFILLTAFVAFASALSVFWLFGLVLKDARAAAAGALAVLCLGTFAILYAPVRLMTGADTTYTFEYFPFLRRYVPALPFPFLFIFCALTWRALSSDESRAVWRSVAAAGATFGVLVFSYFYLWTAAVAWLASLTTLYLLARPENYGAALKLFAALFVLFGAILLPYFVLLSNRAPTMDTVQLLALSHAPDFSRSSIKLGLMVLIALAFFIWRGRLDWRDRRILFAASFALTPLILFNQQIITGRSLQPLHYELYIAKYMALVALVFTVALVKGGREIEWRHARTRVLACVAVVSLGWGMVETIVETKRHGWASVDRDEAMVVAQKLSELGRDPATGASDTRSVVLYTNLEHADFSPVVAPQPVLWSPHVPAFSGVSLEENRERIYQYLYYTGEDFTRIDPEKFEALDDKRKYLIHSLIEWGHNDPAWTVNWKEITHADVRDAIDGYAGYAAAFDRARASSPTLAYVVTTGDANVDFKNLDRWYERDVGERIGRFTLYRVRLRP